MSCFYIGDGSGNGNNLKVGSDNRAQVRSVSRPESINGAGEGKSYNINTGLISVNGDATLLYFKNNAEDNFIVELIVVAEFEGITHSDDPYITLVRNPTGGDLISDATAVSINQNLNFGSASTTTADVYKGKVGGTLTGGDDAAILHVAPGSRSAYPVNALLPKGTSLGVKLTANVSGGSANYYLAIVGYYDDNIDS